MSLLDETVVGDRRTHRLLRDYVRFLWSNLALILLLLLAGAAAGHALSIHEGYTYSSTTVLNSTNQSRFSAYTKLPTSDAVLTEVASGQAAINDLRSRVEVISRRANLTIEITVEATSPETAEAEARAITDATVAAALDLDSDVDKNATSPLYLQSAASAPIIANIDVLRLYRIAGAAFGVLIGICIGAIREASGVKVRSEREVRLLADPYDVPVLANPLTHRVRTGHLFDDVQATSVILHDPRALLINVSPMTKELQLRQIVDVLLKHAAISDGRRSLVIDTGVSLEFLPAAFTSSGIPGLRAVLLGETYLKDAIVENAIEGADFIGAGNDPTLSTEAADSELFKSFIDEMKRSYSLIIILREGFVPQRVEIADVRIGYFQLSQQTRNEIRDWMQLSSDFRQSIAIVESK